MPDTPLTLGVDHVGLAVRDLEASEGFFTSCLGWKRVAASPSTLRPSCRTTTRC